MDTVFDEPIIMRGGPVFKRGGREKRPCMDATGVDDIPAVMRGGPIFKGGGREKRPSLEAAGENDSVPVVLRGGPVFKRGGREKGSFAIDLTPELLMQTFAMGIRK